jgi:hypothetical protein
MALIVTSGSSVTGYMPLFCMRLSIYRTRAPAGNSTPQLTSRPRLTSIHRPVARGTSGVLRYGRRLWRRGPGGCGSPAPLRRGASWRPFPLGWGAGGHEAPPARRARRAARRAGWSSRGQAGCSAALAGLMVPGCRSVVSGGRGEAGLTWRTGTSWSVNHRIGERTNSENPRTIRRLTIEATVTL